MLEAQARSLESIIKNPKGKALKGDKSKTSITWDSHVELEAYITKLQVGDVYLMVISSTIPLGRRRTAYH